MKRLSIIIRGIILSVLLCGFVTSCKSDPFEELDKCQTDIVSCVNKEELRMIDNKFTQIHVSTDIKKLSKTEARLWVIKVAKTMLMREIKCQILDATNALKLNITKDEMKELTQKCFAAGFTNKGFTDIDIKALVRNYWEKKQKSN